MELTELNRPFSILQQLARIEARIRSIVDERYISLVRTGFHHLESAASTSNDLIATSELEMARRVFAQISMTNFSNMPGNIVGSETGPYITGLGYVGNFHYFNLRRDRKNALLQVYNCTLQNLLVGLHYFSASFFSMDYLERLAGALSNLERAKSDLNSARLGNFGSRLGSGTGNAAKLAAGTTAGLGAGLAASLLTGGAALPIVALGAAGAVIKGMGGFKEADTADTSGYENAVTSAEQTIEALGQSLGDECRFRIAELGRVSLGSGLFGSSLNPRIWG